MIYLIVIATYVFARYYIKDLVDYLYYSGIFGVICTVIVFSIGGLSAAESIAPMVLTGFILMFFEALVKVFSQTEENPSEARKNKKSRRR